MKYVFNFIGQFALILIYHSLSVAQYNPKANPTYPYRPTYAPTVSPSISPYACPSSGSAKCSCLCPSQVGAGPTPVPSVVPTPVAFLERAEIFQDLVENYAEQFQNMGVIIDNSLIPAECVIGANGGVSCTSTFGSFTTNLNNLESSRLICACSPAHLGNINVNADLTFARQSGTIEGEGVFTVGDLFFAQCTRYSERGVPSYVNFDVSYINTNALSFNMFGNSAIDQYGGEFNIGRPGNNLGISFLCDEGNIGAGGQCRFTTNTCSLTGSASYYDPNGAASNSSIQCSAEFFGPAVTRGGQCSAAFYIKAEERGADIGGTGRDEFEVGLQLIFTQ